MALLCKISQENCKFSLELFLLIITLCNGIGTTHCEVTWKSGHFHVRKGIVYDAVPSIKQSNARSHLGCAVSCLKNTTCLIYNYNTLSEECEQFTFHTGHDGQFTPYSGWIAGVYKGCKEGFLRLGQSCYNFVTNTTSWTDAQKACAAMSSHLLTLNNNEESIKINAFINDYREDLWDETFWAGLNKIGSTDWSWDDESSATYTFWQGNNPDDYYFNTIDSSYPHEDCMYVQNTWSQASLKWDDAMCNRSEALHRFICEI